MKINHAQFRKLYPVALRAECSANVRHLSRRTLQRGLTSYIKSQHDKKYLHARMSWSTAKTRMLAYAARIQNDFYAGAYDESVMTPAAAAE